jgi:NTP pyrophosphatase (non-canonical NTP hydrolase)
MTEKQKEILKKLREKYGNKAQIAVCTEELCELSSVISKFIRYDKEETAISDTKHKVTDEFCDVLIILEHIREIYKISDTDIEQGVSRKINRANKWLNTNKSMEVTTQIRGV